MKFKFLMLFMAATFTLVSCGDGKKKEDSPEKAPEKEAVKQEEPKKEVTTATFDENEPTLDNKGIGPIKNVTLGAIDEAMAAKGKELFKANCTACHKFKKKYIGPALKGVTKLRSPEWIMNMVLNTEEMLAKDPVAKGLIAKYNAPMARQSLTEEEVRSILEYFRLKDSQ
jgi:cytochrome c551/c552